MNEQVISIVKELGQELLTKSPDTLKEIASKIKESNIEGFDFLASTGGVLGTVSSFFGAGSDNNLTELASKYLPQLKSLYDMVSDLDSKKVLDIVMNVLGK